MKTFRTGQSVAYGVYASLRAFDVRYVGADGEDLDGRAGAEYVRVPTLLMLALAPVAGGLFVIAFPALVLGLVVAAATKPAWSALASLADKRAHLAVVQWQPTAAYLRPPQDEAQAESVAVPTEAQQLIDLEREVAARRGPKS